MDKWLVVWHEAFEGNDWFVLEADRNASDESLEELATAEIKKGYGFFGLEEEPEYYTDFIINITALCEEDGEDKNQIALIWHIEDVRETRPDLTDEQCREVLARVKDRHDPDLGVSWDTLEINADYLYPLNEEVDA